VKIFRVLLVIAVTLSIVGACGGGGNGPSPAPSLYGRTDSR
jgi:hypothetical protein